MNQCTKLYLYFNPMLYKLLLPILRHLNNHGYFTSMSNYQASVNIKQNTFVYYLFLQTMIADKIHFIQSLYLLYIIISEENFL